MKPKARARKVIHPGLPDPKILDLVDVFLFLADARIPWTSVKLAAPFLTRTKRVYVLAKPDLADRRMTYEWLSVLSADGTPAFAVNCRTGDGVEDLVEHLKERKEDLDRRRPAGMLTRPIRTMMFGPPNVGKSSLGNRLLGTQKAPFGAKPGLTRGSHWLRGRGFLEVLDTPGVVETSQVKGDARMKMAAAWALTETAYDAQDVAFWLVRRLADAGRAGDASEGPPTNEAASNEAASNEAASNEAASNTAEKHALSHLEEFGRQRGFLRQGGTVDLDRACKAFIQAFREGNLGRITLEKPSDFGKAAPGATPRPDTGSTPEA